MPCEALGFGGGWFGGTLVFGGFGFCDDTPPPIPPEIPSNVQNIDDTRGRLGCGVPSFFITGRCAGTVVCVLDDQVSSYNWSRLLDDVSKAEVTVALGGDPFFTCGQCLADTEPWCHELHVWRDGEEVWVGPIQEIEYSFNEITVRASDSLAWLGVRIPTASIAPAVPEDLTTTAIGLLTQAFSEDSPTYTCEMDNLFTEPSGHVIQTFYEAYNQTALEILRDLGELGLNFTTLGRTIVLVGDSIPLTPLILLNDEHVIGNIVVTKDGTLQGNRFYVHFNDDGGIPVVGEAAEFYCYSAIERIRDGEGLPDGASAGQAADQYAAASAITPRVVEIPSGSRLSPDTPWTINQMVPGARVDVAITRLPLALTSSFILTGVEVTGNSADGESVGITLIPLQVAPGPV